MQIDDFIKQSAHVSHRKAKKLAKQILGVEPYWNWDAPRTREGFYRYQGGTQCAINRAVAFAPYCDLLWMETKKPIYEQAKEFADGVHAVHPGKWLAYNLSPSFNWSAAGLDENQMKSYVWDLGKLGFVWQFITVRLAPRSLLSDVAVVVIVERSGPRLTLVFPSPHSSPACTRTPTSRTCSPRALQRCVALRPAILLEPNQPS